MLLWFTSIHAQLLVSGAKTPTQLVQDVLLGQGVTVTNVSYTGAGVARGEFDGVNANVGFDGGVILTSGRINFAPGPNNTGSRSGNNGRPGDADINAIISPTISRDAAVLEFDFYVAADTIFFDYVFGSEEYPEFAPPFNSSFNDAFAFLLTGPNPAGGNYNKLNLAKIPGTNTPVSINNVNAITNNSYYVYNGNGSQFPYNSSSFYIQYDAFTVPLTATAAVVPCATYHIKLVVADAADFVYDSGVFLEENSFGANVKNPTIDFISSAPACHGDSVDFLNTGTSSAGILYSWDFGAGASPATSGIENPKNVVYSTPGLKLVTLDMNVNCGDTILRLSKGIAIDEKPAPSFTSNAPQCENQPVNFTYNGSTGSNWTYLWDFGSGASPNTSSAQSPSGILYGSPGSKTITLTVSNGNCKETFNQTITINDRPTASFSNTGPAGISYGVDFTNTGTSGASYSWNFGSGATPSNSTAENPSNVVYSSTGTKTITLITNSSGCADTSIGFMDILVTPAPSFSSNAPQPVGFPLLFSYTGSTGTNFTYSWDFGSGATPAISNSATPPSIYYSTAGVKTITLTVTNGPIVITITQTITIDLPPQPSTPFTSTAPNCEGAPIDFQVTGISGTTYSWDFGSGATPATSTTQNPLGVVYSSSGFKTVQLISDLGGSKDTSEQVIYIIPQPKPVFTHNAPQCEAAEVNFAYAGNTGTGWIYSWDFGTGSSPNISSAVMPQGITYSGSGNKIVKLSVTNGFCSELDTQMISINPTPVVGFSSTAPSCTGDSISFGNNGSSGLSYSWSFGQTSIPVNSTDENPSGITYSSSGIKTITQIVSQGSCSDTSSMTINVLERPQAVFTHNAPQCQGSPVSIISGTTNQAWTYTWDFGTGSNPSNSGAINPGDVTYSNAGSKIISLTVTNQFCAATDTQTIVIDTTPVAQIYTSAPACQSDTFDLFATGFNGSASAYSFVYNLFSPTAFHDPLNGKAVYMDDGIQKVRLIMGIGNCYDSTELSLTIREKPLADFTTTAPVCQGERIDFFNTGSNGLRWNYRWDFGTSATPGFSTAENPTKVHFSKSGKHLISLKTHDIHCSITDTMSIWINELPITEAGIDTIICADDCIEIGEVSTPGYSYQWFPASNLSDASVSNPTACPPAEFSVYVLSATIDTSGCTASDTVLITMLTSALSEAGADVEICVGDSAQIGAAIIRGQTYQWIPSDGLSNANLPSPLASPDTTTKYSLRVSYKNCTEIQDDVVVMVRKAIARAGEDVTLARGESVELRGSGGITYKWTPQDYLTNPNISNPISTPEESILYILEVKDVFNCEDIDTVAITVIDPDYFIPNAFTPNGSGSNDVFRVRGEPLSNFEMSIFDRFGGLVYFSKDFFSAWDGNSQQDGSALAAGAYVYRVRGTDQNGEDVLFSGLVNLIR